MSMAYTVERDRPVVMELDAAALAQDARQGQVMVAAVHAFLGRFVSYPSEHAHVAHALWCVHTHLMAVWDSTPRIAFLSAEPGSGKSRAMEISERLVPRPMEAVNMSPSALFRSVLSPGGLPTILFDEIDTVFGPKAKDNEDIRGLLNAGHRRGSKTYRSVIRGANIELEAIEAYSALALAGLGWLPDTILSRAIVVRMRRRHSDEHIEPYRRRLHAAAGDAVRSKIEVWAAAQSVDTLPYLPLPDEIQDRDADVWEPLIAIADAIGGEWSGRARKAAVALVAASKDVEASLGVRLLADLRIVFGNDDEMSSKEILRKLIALEESPWGDLKGRPMDERGLARRLHHYSVKSKSVRIGPATPKGYTRADLMDAWSRYLPKPLTTATNATPDAEQANA